METKIFQQQDAAEAYDALGYLLKVVAHELRLQMDRQLAELNLTTPQYAALAAIAQGRLTNAELARRCFVTPQTMNGILQNLAGRQLVRREQDPQHGLKAPYALTAAAAALLAQAQLRVMAIEARMQAALGPDAAAALQQGLQACLAALGEADPTEGCSGDADASSRG